MEGLFVEVLAGHKRPATMAAIPAPGLTGQDTHHFVCQ